MPFTFSHPAIILPLVKSKKLNPIALIIGSMSPDFEFFIRFDLIKTFSHNFWAMFYFNLPLTIIVFIIFNLFVKNALILNLPHFLYVRFKPYFYNFKINKSAKSWGYILISALIGIFSHLFWDNFTHKAGLFPELVSFLQQKQSFLNFYTFRFVYLQFISSIAGGLYIVYFIYKMPKYESYNPNNSYKFWLNALIITFIIITIRDCQTIQQLIATGLSAGMISLFFSSIIFTKKLHIKTRI